MTPPMAAVVLGVVAVAFGVSWAGVRVFEWRQVFQPTRRVRRTPDEVGLAYEEIRFVTEDSTFLNGWWVPAEASGGTLIYLHGSGGNMGDRVEVLRDLHRLGVNVFTFDYRGYGNSRGIPSEQGLYRDARAAYEVVRARHHDDEDPPVVAYGRSLGGAVAIQLALDKPLRGLVVEGTFLGIVPMAEHRHPGLPVRRFGSIRFDSQSKVGRLSLPKLVAHSRDDDVIPFDQGRRLHETCAAPSRFRELRGPHDQLGWVGTPGYWEEFRGFIMSALENSFPRQ